MVEALVLAWSLQEAFSHLHHLFSLEAEEDLQWRVQSCQFEMGPEVPPFGVLPLPRALSPLLPFLASLVPQLVSEEHQVHSYLV